MPFVKGNKSPYIVTNPDPETVITDKDIVFILSPYHPPESSVDWGAPFETESKPTKESKFIKIEAKKKENHEEEGIINPGKSIPT